MSGSVGERTTTHAPVILSEAKDLPPAREFRRAPRKALPTAPDDGTKSGLTSGLLLKNPDPDPILSGCPTVSPHTRKRPSPTSSAATAVPSPRPPSRPAPTIPPPPGRSWRARAVAACHAEIAHRSRDFARVERALGLTFDRWLEPDCEQLGQFPHEAHAGAALVWLSHLQTHESEKRTPWSGVPFRSWPEADRARWFAKRRDPMVGFVRQVERYRSSAG